MKIHHEPRLIFWELTKQCNLRCRHCRAEADDSLFQGEAPLEQICSVIDHLAEHYNPIVVLTGGEPLYRPDIFEIASHVTSRGLRAALASNGTLIDGDIARSIARAGIRRVSISIDGSDAATHDSFRGIPGSFDQALRGARFLARAGVEFQFNCTVSRRNVDQIEDILRLSEAEGACALHIFMLVPVGCGVEIAQTEMISKERYEEVLNWFYDRSRETGLELKATCAPHYYRIIRQRARAEGRKITFESDGMTAMTRGCLAGTGVCFISHRGDVQPCGYLPLVAGNVYDTSLKEIWDTSELFQRLRDFNALRGNCGACEFRVFCGGCRARAYYETGDYLETEPYCLYVPEKMR
jgi:heme b synthase